MNTNPIDLAAGFAALAASGETERTVTEGGVAARLVRVAGGGPGRWDAHPNTTEIAIVHSGDFTVAFRDRTVHLSAGQCCVVPAGAEHRGTSERGAEVALFQQVP